MSINLEGPNGKVQVPLTTDSTVFSLGTKYSFPFAVPLSIDEINNVSLKWTKKNFLFSDFLYIDRIVIKPNYLPQTDQGYKVKSYCGKEGRRELTSEQWVLFEKSNC